MSKRTPGGRYGDGRVAFLAMLEEVRAAVRAGRTLRAIYDEKRPLLGVSYVQFTRYANRFVIGVEGSPGRVLAAPPPVAAAVAAGPGPEGRPGPRVVTLSQARQFRHDSTGENDEQLF